MKIFIDSANIDEVRLASSWCIVDGATTNPSLIAKEGRDLKETVLEICKLVRGPVSAEIMSTDAVSMVQEAKEIAKWHQNIVIKIPCTFEGLKAVKVLKKFSIKTNVTLVFSPNQVLLAAKAGADYVSLFVGRLDDVGEDGLLAVAESIDILAKHHLEASLIVASIRSPITVQKAASIGAHCATVPFKILEQMIQHPLTDVGIKKFADDWGKAKR